MEDWELLSETSQQIGYRTIANQRYRLPTNHEAVYNVLIEPQVASVLALTPDQQVIIAKQFRPGPGRVLFELPGGAIEPHEQPLAAAARELLEETGYIGELTSTGHSFEHAYSTLERFHFVATNCLFQQPPQLDPGEAVEVELLPLAEFKQHLFNGELTDSNNAFRGLYHLGLL